VCVNAGGSPTHTPHIHTHTHAHDSRYTKRTDKAVDRAAVTQQALAEAAMEGFVNTVLVHRPDEKPPATSAFKHVVSARTHTRTHTHAAAHAHFSCAGYQCDVVQGVPAG
jgi:hypothetical protein